jgi:hypothetical protein
VRPAHDSEQIGVGADDEGDGDRTKHDGGLDADAGDSSHLFGPALGKVLEFGHAAAVPVAGERVDHLAEPDGELDVGQRVSAHRHKRGARLDVAVAKELPVQSAHVQ